MVSVQVLDGTGTIRFYYATNSNNVGTTAVDTGVSYAVSGNPTPPYNVSVAVRLPVAAVASRQGTIQVPFYKLSNNLVFLNHGFMFFLRLNRPCTRRTTRSTNA